MGLLHGSRFRWDSGARALALEALLLGSGRRSTVHAGEPGEPATLDGIAAPARNSG